MGDDADGAPSRFGAALGSATRWQAVHRGLARLRCPENGRVRFRPASIRVTGIVRRRHRAAEFIELLRLLDRAVPKGQVIHLILDPVGMHRSAEVAVYLYDHPDRFAFHWLPLHASWLSFIEAWFAMLTKKCRKRSELADFPAAAAAITAFIATSDAHHAHPFTRKKGVRFYQRLKDKLAAAHPPPLLDAQAA